MRVKFTVPPLHLGALPGCDRVPVEAENSIQDRACPTLFMDKSRDKYIKALTI